jgi:UDP-glucose 4-epimerase
LTERRRVVAITGCSGYIGTKLLRALDDDPRVEEVVGVDLKPPQVRSEKLRFYRQSIGAPLAALFARHQVDTALHLVFVFDPIHDRSRARRIDLGGTHNFLRACHDAGVRTLFYASSTTAYGAHPDNPERLVESSPLRPVRGFAYSEDKAVTDAMCRRFAVAHPDRRVLILRAPILFGPNTNNFVGRFMDKRIVFQVAGADPEMQFAHEDDYVAGVLALLEAAPGGVYNLTPPGTIRYSEIARLFARRPVPLPPAVLYPLAEASWQLRLRAFTEAPATVLDFIRWPWLASSEKLRRETGFACRVPSGEALGEYVAARRRAGLTPVRPR